MFARLYLCHLFTVLRWGGTQQDAVFLHLDDMLHNLTKTEIICHLQVVQHAVPLHFQQ